VFLEPPFVSSGLASCYLRSKAITSRVFPNIYRPFLSPPRHNLCLCCTFEGCPK